MNILFVNYGGLRSNSIEHIFGFAGALEALGHSCTVALPEEESGRGVSLRLVGYDHVINGLPLFGEDASPDIIHAWTPRECVRRAVLPALRRYPDARLVLHLEDNEQWITARTAGVPYRQLLGCSPRECAYLVPPHCMHPHHGAAFLGQADGVTVITPSLADFVPEGIPVQSVLPGVDVRMFRPMPPDPALRRMFDIPENARLIYYPGGVNSMNRDDLLLLFQALPMINRQGLVCHLIQTGPHADEFIGQVDPSLRRYVHVAGYVDKDMVPRLMALADVLVQPGRLDMFNRYRLPSKIPQFLAAGRPVIIPDANIADLLEDDRDVLLLREGTSEEIARRCIELFMNPDKAARMGAAAAAFAQAHFDAESNTRRLLSFYESVTKRAAGSGGASPSVSRGWGALRWLDPLWMHSRLLRLKYRGLVRPDEDPVR
ncbi:MAG: glycosyltransferase [Spartobacteria bacterium]|nr:glycosyltransferase [Spartobacteria bacterium]